jgi:ATP-dependent Clp protease adapter protein ClpS
MKVSDALDETLGAAAREALDRRHGTVDREHLLWALIDDSRVARALRLAGIDVERLEEDVDLHLSRIVDAAPDGFAGAFSKSFDRLVAKAATTAQHSIRTSIDVIDVLGAFCRLDEGDHFKLATQQGVPRVAVLHAICHGLAPSEVISKLTPPIRKGSDELWTITLHNDDYTTQAFVTEILTTVFELTVVAANEMMLRIHRTDRVAIGTYAASMAENRIATVARMAREKSFPLLVTAERSGPSYR